MLLYFWVQVRRQIQSCIQEPFQKKQTLYTHTPECGCNADTGFLDPLGVHSVGDNRYHGRSCVSLVDGIHDDGDAVLAEVKDPEFAGPGCPVIPGCKNVDA